MVIERLRLILNDDRVVGEIRYHLSQEMKQRREGVLSTTTHGVMQ